MGILYIISGIGGNLASAIFLPDLLSVGASGTPIVTIHSIGALFGVIGLALVSNIKNWSSTHKPCRSLVGLCISIIITLAIGLLPLVDNFCHLGGLITGSFVSCFLLPGT